MTLIILVVHEATHKMFVISRNHNWLIVLNQLFGTVVCIASSRAYFKLTKYIIVVYIYFYANIVVTN